MSLIWSFLLARTLCVYVWVHVLESIFLKLVVFVGEFLLGGVWWLPTVTLLVCRVWLNLLSLLLRRQVLLDTFLVKVSVRALWSIALTSHSLSSISVEISVKICVFGLSGRQERLEVLIFV